MREESAVPDFSPCPGCHPGDFPDFDHFVDVNNIPADLVGEAFGFWMAGETGWAGSAMRMGDDHG